MSEPKTSFIHFLHSRKRKAVILLGILGVTVGIVVITHPNLEDLTPRTKQNGEKWNLAYYEGGPYIHYRLYLISIMEEFMKYGWMEPLEFPNTTTDQSYEIWSFLASNMKSDYLEIEIENFWTSNWTEELRADTLSNFIDTSTTQTFDLILAMGTWAGQDLSTDEIQIPTIINSCSDPIKAGIIQSANDAKYDHIWAFSDPTLFERQIQTFYNIFQFQNMGIIYENTSDGRYFAHLDEARKIATRNGFSLVERTAAVESGGSSVIEQNYLSALNNISSNIDALFFAEQLAAEEHHISKYLPTIIENEILSYSTLGEEIVKYGILISLVEPIKEISEFALSIIVSVFSGKTPGDLQSGLETGIKLAINLKTAELMNITIPDALINVASYTYSEIIDWSG